MKYIPIHHTRARTSSLYHSIIIQKRAQKIDECLMWRVMKSYSSIANVHPNGLMEVSSVLELRRASSSAG